MTWWDVNCRGLAAGGLKALTEVLQLIGGATLAVQTVVLGASLFQKAKRQQPRAPDQAAPADPVLAPAAAAGRVAETQGSSP